jgi:hypothetical protein
MIIKIRRIFIYLFTSMIILSSCTALGEGFNPSPSPTASPSQTITPTITQTPTSKATNTPTLTLTATKTLKPTNTQTATITPTSTITSTPTFAFPGVEVNVAAAHCRYGPAKAYLHAADLYEGDKGVVQGRFQYSDWLYVKWEKLDYRCWVSSYVVDISGDVAAINYHRVGLDRIPSTLYQKPNNVRATRDGDMVTITWDRVNMTEDDDRGYLIDAFVCQDGMYLWWPVSFPDQYTTQYTVRDEKGCAFESKGKIFTVEKHGYTEPASIPWPSR